MKIKYAFSSLNQKKFKLDINKDCVTVKMRDAIKNEAEWVFL